MSEVSRAIVVYGRVGTYATRTASLKKDAPGDLGMWRECAESMERHVVAPWRAAGRVDVFVQSWNLEMAASDYAKERRFQSLKETRSLALSPDGVDFL